LPESEVFLRAKAAEVERGHTTTQKTKIFLKEMNEMLKKHWLLCIYAVLLMTGELAFIYQLFIPSRTTPVSGTTASGSFLMSLIADHFHYRLQLPIPWIAGQFFSNNANLNFIVNCESSFTGSLSHLSHNYQRNIDAQRDCSDDHRKLCMYFIFSKHVLSFLRTFCNLRVLLRKFDDALPFIPLICGHLSQGRCLRWMVEPAYWEAIDHYVRLMHPLSIPSTRIANCKRFFSIHVMLIGGMYILS